MRPSDRSGDRDEYFVALQRALRKASISTPTLVIDRERLNQNIELMKTHLPDKMGYRVVAKSLPALELIKHVCRVANSQRLMTFNLPMLLALSQQMPGADQLLGKPMPIGAAQAYFEKISDSRATRQIQWLIDTPQRLGQYEELARGLKLCLRVNVELDVGLCRGGFLPDRDLAATLQKISESQYLRFSGFMGYEAHVGALPKVLGIRRRACEQAWSTYTQAIDIAQTIVKQDVLSQCTLNAGGSPTYRLYQTTEVVNEVAVGSALVKPTHFDTDLLRIHCPASFIATPIIKQIEPTKMPSILAWFDWVRYIWDPNYRRTVLYMGATGWQTQLTRLG